MVIAEKINIFGIKLPEILEDESTLNDIIKSNPVERGDSLVKRAIISFKSGRYNSAYEDLESGVSENPEKLYEESHCLFALLNYLKNDMKSAL